MRPRALWLLPLLVAGTLSGCVAPEPDGSPSPSTDPRITAGTYEPWTVSDWWQFDMQVRGFDRYDETRLVYYEESGPEFVVGTPNEAEALYHAVFSVNPILGRIHQGHLSPHERGVHTTMFPFENGVIEDGKTWTTVFYERQLRLTASYSDSIATPMGTQPGYRIQGTTADGTLTVDYTYVRAAKWFTELRVTDAEGDRVHLELTDLGTGHSGAAHFIRAKDLFHRTLSGSGLMPVEARFQVTQDMVDGHRVESFAISTDITLESGINAVLRVLDPQGNVIYERRYNDESDGEFDIRQVWPTGADTTGTPLGDRPQWSPGTYTVRLSLSGTASAEIHIVGTQDNSGSV